MNLCKAVSVAICSCISVAALAAGTSPGGSPGTPENWSGTGQVLSPTLDPQGAFTVSMRNEALDATHRRSTITVVIPDGTKGGRTEVTTCDIAFTAKGWRSDCATAGAKAGGWGFCFKNRVCQEYTQTPDGKFLGTVLVFDGETRIRLGHTQMENGKVTRFLEETLDLLKDSKQ